MVILNRSEYIKHVLIMMTSLIALLQLLLYTCTGKCICTNMHNIKKRLIILCNSNKWTNWTLGGQCIWTELDEAGGLSATLAVNRLGRVLFVGGFLCVFYTLLSQWEFLPCKIRFAYPKESQLQQRRATQSQLIKTHGGSFRVSVIHRTLTRTTGPLTCVGHYSYACEYARGLGTPTARQHMFHSKKTHICFLCS